jgi:hypothetical protein
MDHTNFQDLVELGNVIIEVLKLMKQYHVFDQIKKLFKNKKLKKIKKKRR